MTDRNEEVVPYPLPFPFNREAFEALKFVVYPRDSYRDDMLPHMAHFIRERFSVHTALKIFVGGWTSRDLDCFAVFLSKTGAVELRYPTRALDHVDSSFVSACLAAAFQGPRLDFWIQIGGLSLNITNEEQAWPSIEVDNSRLAMLLHWDNKLDDVDFARLALHVRHLSIPPVVSKYLRIIIIGGVPNCLFPAIMEKLSETTNLGSLSTCKISTGNETTLARIDIFLGSAAAANLKCLIVDVPLSPRATTNLAAGLQVSKVEELWLVGSRFIQGLFPPMMQPGSLASLEHLFTQFPSTLTKLSIGLQFLNEAHLQDLLNAVIANTTLHRLNILSPYSKILPTDFWNTVMHCCHRNLAIRVSCREFPVELVPRVLSLVRNRARHNDERKKLVGTVLFSLLRNEGPSSPIWQSLKAHYKKKKPARRKPIPRFSIAGITLGVLPVMKIG